MKKQKLYQKDKKIENWLKKVGYDNSKKDFFTLLKKAVSVPSFASLRPHRA